MARRTTSPSTRSTGTRQGRSEQIQIINAATGTVLDTETISSFSAGTSTLQWAVTGNVVFTVTSLAGPNAVISGLFFDPPPSSTPNLTLAPIPAQTMCVYPAISTVTLDGTDADGDPLTYAATTSDSVPVTITISGDLLMIAPATGTQAPSSSRPVLATARVIPPIRRSR